jgi:hypothetical protein
MSFVNVLEGFAVELNFYICHEIKYAFYSYICEQMLSELTVENEALTQAFGYCLWLRRTEEGVADWAYAGICAGTLSEVRWQRDVTFWRCRHGADICGQDCLISWRILEYRSTLMCVKKICKSIFKI